uniref:Uncharacterized protein n=1 Tax=Anguilla anguilla TaxID=7936 RepID=A0A0E9V2D7_ANGAN
MLGLCLCLARQFFVCDETFMTTCQLFIAEHRAISVVCGLKQENTIQVTAK